MKLILDIVLLIFCAVMIGLFALLVLVLILSFFNPKNKK